MDFVVNGWAVAALAASGWLLFGLQYLRYRQLDQQLFERNVAFLISDRVANNLGACDADYVEAGVEVLGELESLNER